MRDVLLIIDRDIADSLIATGLVRRLSQEGCRVHCLTDSGCGNILRYSECRVTDILYGSRCKYDLAINVSTTDLAIKTINSVSAKEKVGFSRENERLVFLNEGADRFYRAKYVGIPTDANIFQLLFGLANITWQGEGYSFDYFPRNRTKKSLTGVAVRNSGLRTFLENNLKISSRLWDIPFKQNILKQFDETNRCKSVITDDNVLLHVAVSLRKNVEFLTWKKPTYKIEMFGRGSVHILDPQILESKIPNAGT